MLLLHLIALGTINSVLPSIIQERGWSPQEIIMAFHVINLLRSVISALGIGCLLAAIFLRRPA